MREQISGNGGCDIVTARGPEALEMTVTIVSFMPYAEPAVGGSAAGSARVGRAFSTRIADPADP